MPGGYVCSASMKGAARQRRRQARSCVGERPVASCSPRSSARSTTSTLPRGSRSTTRAARPDLRAQAEVPPRGARRARWSPSCGCIPTARASSSCRRSARPAEMFQVANETRAYLTGEGHRRRGGAADEDGDRAGLLRRPAVVMIGDVVIGPRGLSARAVARPVRLVGRTPVVGSVVRQIGEGSPPTGARACVGSSSSSRSCNACSTGARRPRDRRGRAVAGPEPGRRARRRPGASRARRRQHRGGRARRRRTEQTFSACWRATRCS